MDTPAAPRDSLRSPAWAARIFILNDHEPVRRGLRDLLENDGFVIAGESGSAAEARHLIPILEPDLAVLDDRLPDGTGIEVCRDLRASAPGVRCLILTGWDEQHAVRAAVLAGASGYVLKQVSDNSELLDGIRSAAAGSSLLRPGVRERIAESLYAASSASWLDSLTERERNVLAFMARGLTNQQIGQDLMVADEVVAACVSSVLQKLGFRRRSQLIPVPIPRAWELLH
ncbi:response regulator transcription factor [Pseudarthrobacter sp. BRE9]|jgi:DNA-binding NarL/FixJ family response regulator|uniref:response regulator transcription factor n=1 Tax=Pseudarthrobacter sp. BRE9 TaxID=2962582 RepID=UPI0028827D9C|nr:response regulator transcription factor [Pseudarthrobacter sp. BRE9]MDT0169703.1 response regulator transcription factor [Pseudarthrobacter sp. BRE9]